ncbi:hypothetical protein [Aestuariivirga sp.]|uniref:hypothetical protein n=1 Tax=Aestuariivirga sp. TaxID=2650926 RepID=UPI003594042B
MEQEIIKPDTQPKAGTQAFSPLGCLIAATGATLMVFCMMASAMVATVWALSKLAGLPDMFMYALMAVGLIPVLWVTAWTAGRAWHVEQLLAAQKDVDVPVFNLRHYFAKH